MTHYLYPSTNFISKGKAVARTGKPFSIIIKQPRKKDSFDKARLFLLNEKGSPIGALALLKASFSLLGLIVVHFFAIGMSYSVNEEKDDDAIVLNYFVSVPNGVGENLP